MDPQASPSPAQPRSLLGPLTSTFAPPAGCTVPVVKCATCEAGWYAQTCGASTGAGDAAACWPGTTAGAPIPTPPYGGWGFYSPGTLCPSGYSPACSATYGVTTTSGWTFMFALTQGETAIGCCPHGMACWGSISGVWDGIQTCGAHYVSTIISGAVSCNGTDRVSLAWTIPATYTVTSTQSSGTAVIASVMTLATATLYAPLIQINHRASDLSSGSPTGSLTTTGPTTLPSTTNASEGNGLSVGSIVGISVGAVVGVAILAWATAFLCLRRRRRARNVETRPVPPLEVDGLAKATHELDMGHNKPEFPSSMPHQHAAELGTSALEPRR